MTPHLCSYLAWWRTTLSLFPSPLVQLCPFSLIVAQEGVIVLSHLAIVVVDCNGVATHRQGYTPMTLRPFLKWNFYSRYLRFRQPVRKRIGLSTARTTSPS